MSPLIDPRDDDGEPEPWQAEPDLMAFVLRLEAMYRGREPLLSADDEEPDPEDFRWRRL
jgi:hypothetical protein